ncbi:MAG: sulfatase-like hydrolase/transferase [Methanosarcinales archaeon]
MDNMRNIVLITWDSVRADHCGCYGYPKNTTPFLDKMAEEGLRFENAIVSGVPTPASMPGIFTSRHFNEKKITSELTLAQVLSEKYKTAAFHSNPYASRYFGFNKGFETFKDYLWMDKDGYGGEQSSVLRRSMVKLLSNLRIVDLERVRFYYNVLNTVIRNEYISGFLLKDFYRDVIDWVQKNDDGYFLWILMIETHFPYAPPSWNRWKKAKAMLIHDKFYNAGGIEKKVPLKIKDKEQRMVINAYDECIREADRWTEWLWEDVRDDDPVFIIHADHGDAFGEHNFYGHPSEHYEYLIRVPLIIYNADVKGVVKEPVSLLRLAPTICELAGVDNNFKNPGLFEDVSYTPPVVENKLKEGFRITVRDKEWKLIVNPDRENELYNLIEDPIEGENLIREEAGVKKELEDIVKSHRKRATRQDIGVKIQRLKSLKTI